jgi:hypothetical protein
MAKRFLVLIALLTLGFFVVGCADGDKSASVVNPNPDQFSPVGSISGVVYDFCTSVPVKGAVVSVAYAGRVHQVTTASNGAYSFDNVPANEMNGDNLEWGYGGGYEVSCDLTKVTGYGYALVDNVAVYYSSLEDGTNNDLSDGAEGGSGANTPVNHLAANLDFTPGPLTSAISGTVYDVSTGRAVSGATVTLYTGVSNTESTFVKTVTSTDGTYSFTNIMPADVNGYRLMVTKAGYEYADLQAPNTVGNTVHYNLVPVLSSVGCGQAIAGINVNMIANPAKDKTVPYIVSVAGGGETDIINLDEFTALVNTDVTSFVVTFSEGMQASRSLKANAVSLASAFTVTVTSSGTSTTTPVEKSASINIIDAEYTVTMTSAGVMTITTPYITEAAMVALVNTATPSPVIAATGATATIGSGSYTINFVASAFPGIAHLTDLSFNPWYIGTPGVVDHGFLHAFGEAYQDNFIFSPGGHSVSIDIGE